MRELDFTLQLDNNRAIQYRGEEKYNSLKKRLAILVKRGQYFKVIDNVDGRDVTDEIAHWGVSLTKKGLSITNCAGRVLQTIPASTLPSDYLNPLGHFDPYRYVRENHQFLIKKHRLDRTYH